MRTQAPLLAPIFRSDGQARLLAELMLFEDTALSAQELADRTGLAYPTVWREVTRLVKAGLLQERLVGRQKLVAADPDSPLTGPLRQILMVAAGPVPLLREALSDIDGIDRACVFGSFAARAQNIDGDSPNDIDVMVIGTPEPLAVYGACRSIGGQVGRPVNATILTPQEWAEESVFISEVKNSPTIALLGADA